MLEIINEYMKWSGLHDYYYSEPVLMIYPPNGSKIQVVFPINLIEHSLLSKKECVKLILDNKLKGVRI